MKEHGISYLDFGVSGEINGVRHGACIMVGGDNNAFMTIKPLLKSICVTDGFTYVGSFGSGHDAKMVHTQLNLV